uniref:Phosphoesterase n=1 Tax=Geoglobus ahangari TaxID=113653 RepID=A0A7C4S5D6_9EURY
MKFVAFSDTHDKVEAIKDLLRELKKEKIDLFFHAGDVISPFALREFSGLENLYIAFGNNDGDRQKLIEIALQNGWKIADVITFENIAVYHGTTREILNLLSKKFEIVIYGHTHEAGIKRDEGVTLVNPGEVCGYLTGKRSYVIYEDGEFSIVEF